MIKKKILNPNRIRHIKGGFGFIPHRFLTDEFLSSLVREEILLYFFLILVSDRYGLSYYSYDAVCSLLRLSMDEYIEARDGLLEKDLIAFDGSLYQVLSLPPKPICDAASHSFSSSFKRTKKSGIGRLIQKSLWEGQSG
ncbi:MAG: hypothetical protein PVG39_26035 [Desulfobacteraceae bacterium]